jgi:hypothetical protein
MTESFVTINRAFIGPDQAFARSLSSLDAPAYKPLRQHPGTACGDLQRRTAPPSLTDSAHTDHFLHRLKAIQYP